MNKPGRCRRHPLHHEPCPMCANERDDEDRARRQCEDDAAVVFNPMSVVTPDSFGGSDYTAPDPPAEAPASDLTPDTSFDGGQSGGGGSDGSW
jgi:hypothetical protein